jgi:hypothetical protein
LLNKFLDNLLNGKSPSTFLPIFANAAGVFNPGSVYRFYGFNHTHNSATLAGILCPEIHGTA